MALLVMALADLGVDASSFTGSQVGIITDDDHTRAKIREVKGDRLREALAAGKVPVVAGFQGVSAAREITTLGRGGSDATAVALAAVLNADACEIYTDVTGVFTADPRIVPEAHRINRISFEEMLEMAATGGRVLMLRAVEFARNHNVPLHVRSSFTWEPGTWVVEEDAEMEDAVVTAVTHDTSEAKVTVSGVPGPPRRGGPALPGPGRQVDQRRHDRPEHVRPRDDGHLVHGPDGRPAGRGGDLPGARRRAGCIGRDGRRRGGPGLAGRGGDEVAPRDRRHHVRDAGQREDQHRHDLDLDHPDLVHRGREATSSGPSAPCTRPLPSADGYQGRGAPHLVAAAPRQDGDRPASGRRRLRPRSGPAGPTRRHRARTPLRRSRRGARTQPQGCAAARDRADLTGRPHGGHGGTGPGRCHRSPAVPAREGPLRGRPRGGARLRAVPARRGQRRHGRGPQPDRAITLAGPPVGPRQEGPRQRGAARLPHLRARCLLLRPRPLGRRRRRNRQAGGHHDPAVPGRVLRPTSAGWRRRPGRRRRTTPRLPWRRRGGAARAARSARRGCPTCRPGDPAQWRRH